MTAKAPSCFYGAHFTILLGEDVAYARVPRDWQAGAARARDQSGGYACNVSLTALGSWDGESTMASAPEVLSSSGLPMPQVTPMAGIEQA